MDNIDIEQIADFTKAIRKKINERCAVRIREANQLADQQIDYAEFILKELRDGAPLKSALDGAATAWPRLVEEMTIIMEEAKL